MEEKSFDWKNCIGCGDRKECLIPIAKPPQPREGGGDPNHLKWGKNLERVLNSMEFGVACVSCRRIMEILHRETMDVRTPSFSFDVAEVSPLMLKDTEEKG